MGWIADEGKKLGATRRREIVTRVAGKGKRLEPEGGKEGVVRWAVVPKLGLTRHSSTKGDDCMMTVTPPPPRLLPPTTTDRTRLY